jgi:hypothetical protein
MFRQDPPSDSLAPKENHSVKFAVFASLLLLSSLSLGGCTEEGHSGDCAAGGRGNLEEVGCDTHVGGGCLSEKDFRANRPSRSEDSQGVERTIDDDWVSYQFTRPQCEFECMTEDEFLHNRTEDPRRENDTVSLDEDYQNYLEMRPECAG